MTKNKIHLRTLPPQADNDESVDLAILSSLCRRALEKENLPIWRRILCHLLLAICDGVDTQMQIKGAEAMLLVVEHEMHATVDHNTRGFQWTVARNMEVITILERLDEVCVRGGNIEFSVEWWMIDAHESKKSCEESRDLRIIAPLLLQCLFWHHIGLSVSPRYAVHSHFIMLTSDTSHDLEWYKTTEDCVSGGARVRQCLC